MCNKKRLGQTAARLLVGMAVGLTGGALAAADSQVPITWNVSPIMDGAYLQTFASAPTWGGQVVGVESKNSHAGVPSRSNLWFVATDPNNVLTLPGDASYTNTLEYASSGGSVSFAVNPVFVDVRVLFTAYDGTPDVGDAKLAVYASAGNTLHVRHNTGTTNINWGGTSLLTDWHQLTVRLQSGGTCAVLLDDTEVASGLTPIGAATTLNSLVFTGGGYADDLYVSHGNPDYPGVLGTLPTGAAGQTWATGGSVSNWLASRINSGALNIGATFDTFDQSKIEVAYLVNELAGTAGAAEPVTTVTFGVSAIDLVSPTLVKVTCKLTVNTVNKEDTINGRIQLQGKTTIGGLYATMSPDAISPKNTDFNGGLATYTFTVPSGMKFFKAQIVE